MVTFSSLPKSPFYKVDNIISFRVFYEAYCDCYVFRDGDELHICHDYADIIDMIESKYHNFDQIDYIEILN